MMNKIIFLINSKNKFTFSVKDDNAEERSKHPNYQ